MGARKNQGGVESLSQMPTTSTGMSVIALKQQQQQQQQQQQHTEYEFSDPPIPLGESVSSFCQQSLARRAKETPLIKASRAWQASPASPLSVYLGPEANQSRRHT